MGVSALFAVIAFCAASPKEEQVFTWLLAISGLSQLSHGLPFVYPILDLEEP